MKTFLNWLVELVKKFWNWLFPQEPTPPPPPPDPEPEIFDYKSGVYPEYLGGLLVGYVRLKQKCILWYADKNKVLTPYQNKEWANNTAGQRINLPAGRVVAVYAKGKNYHYGDPRPNSYDGDTVAYVVMNEQRADGHELWSFEHPQLLVKLTDVVEAWMPE
jgi:hypothetical protein